jgi:hypothetical protein
VGFLTRDKPSEAAPAPVEDEELRAWRRFRDDLLARRRDRYERLARTTAPGHEEAAGLPWLEREIRRLEAYGDDVPDWFTWGEGDFREASKHRTRRPVDAPKTRRLKPGEPWPAGTGMAPGTKIGPGDVVEVPVDG